MGVHRMFTGSLPTDSSTGLSQEGTLNNVWVFTECLQGASLLTPTQVKSGRDLEQCMGVHRMFTGSLPTDSSTGLSQEGTLNNVWVFTECLQAASLLTPTQVKSGRDLEQCMGVHRVFTGSLPTHSYTG